MKSRFLIFGLLLFMAVAVYGSDGEPWRMAVYVTGDIPKEVADIVQNKVTTALTLTGDYRLTERSAEFLKSVNDELKTQYSGTVADGEIARLGEACGANFVCCVNVIMVEKSHYIQVAMRMINVEKRVLEKAGEAESSRYNNPGDLDRVVRAAIDMMLGRKKDTPPQNTPINNNATNSENIVPAAPAAPAAAVVANNYQTSSVDAAIPNPPLEATVINWTIQSSPKGADVYWRIISSTNEVKNTNRNFLGATPYESTETFDIKGLTFGNAGNVQVEISCEKEGFLLQKKKFNLRQVIDQKEISVKFNLVAE